MSPLQEAGLPEEHAELDWKFCGGGATTTVRSFLREGNTVHVTVYKVIVLPEAEEGGDHTIVALVPSVVDGVIDVIEGAPGTTAGGGLHGRQKLA